MHPHPGCRRLAIVRFRGNRALAAGIVALAALAALPLLVGEGGLMSSLVITLIKRLRSQGLAILLSEQNARMSLAIADRAYVIEMGRVVMQGAGRGSSRQGGDRRALSRRRRRGGPRPCRRAPCGAGSGVGTDLARVMPPAA